jgi:hypothetical protein
MEKYGTPQVKEESAGLYKISAEKPKACCAQLLAHMSNLRESAPFICACGNTLSLVEQS